MDCVADALKLFRMSDIHIHYGPDEIYHYLILPCRKGCAKVYYEGKKPVGFISWAWISDSKEQDFLNYEYLLQEEDYEEDWSKNLWGLDFIAPYHNAADIMRKIRNDYKLYFGVKTKAKFRRITKDPLKVHQKEFG